MKSSNYDNNNELLRQLSINDLPDEIIEYILCLIPPYQDLHACMSVCKRWRNNVQNVVRTKHRQLHSSLTDFSINWQCVRPSDKSPPATITKRYSHVAVVHENSMYVFGGCTNSMTTMNDLWRLDLSTREWMRPFAKGVYPTPKANSTMVYYKNTLVLFGGWAHPPPYPYHQSFQFFNELHVYDISENKWYLVTTNNPPPMAGHSVSVHGDWMIVFGGKQHPALNSTHTNDLWKLHLGTHTWYKQQTSSTKPSERYGHSQLILDEHHLLLLGGCGGPNDLYADCWLLRMHGDVWEWKRLEVRGEEFAPPNIWCHPACKVDEYVVVLNGNSNDKRRHVMYSSKYCYPPVMDPVEARRSVPVDRDENVNGRRGVLNRVQQQAGNNLAPSRPPPVIRDNPRPGQLSMSAFSVAPPIRNANRERQLEILLQRQQMIRNQIQGQQQQQPPPQQPTNKRNKPTSKTLVLHLLDTSHALDAEQPYVTWLEPNNKQRCSATGGGPEESLLYSLVQGKGELIMFGGIKKDSGSVSNLLHFICPPNDVI